MCPCTNGRVRISNTSEFCAQLSVIPPTGVNEEHKTCVDSDEIKVLQRDATRESGRLRHTLKTYSTTSAQC